MKALINSSNLLNAVTPLSKVTTSNHASLLILSAIKLEVEDNKLLLTASNMETTMTATIDADNAENGAVAIDAKTFVSLLSTMPDTPITIENKENIVTISWPTGKSSLPDMGANDYPVMSKVTSEPIAIDSLALSQAFDVVTPIIGNDPIRPVINSVCLDLNGNELTVVGTDAHQLGVMKISLSESVSPMRILIPVTSVSAVKSILKDAKGNISLHPGEKETMLVSEDKTVVTRSVEGRYPDYMSVFPKETATEVVTDKEAFVGMLKRVSVCASKSAPTIKLTIANGTIKAQAQDLAFNISSHETFECPNITGENIEIGFDNALLVSLLPRVPGKEIKLQFLDPERPVTISPTSEVQMKAILMPKRVQ